MKKFLIMAMIMIMSIFTISTTTLADDPMVNITDNLVYWQELAVTLAAENNKLRVENERLTKLNEELTLNLNDAESTIKVLQNSLNEMDKLRLQVENDLAISIAQCESLEKIITKLTGIRFGVIIGGTYINGQYGAIAGLNVNF